MRNAVVVVILLLCVVGSVSAATPTATPTPTASPTPVATTVVAMGMTTAQHSMVQSIFVAAANTAKCQRYNLPSSCVTADLISAGCVPKTLQTATKQDPTFVSCTIYSIDATGEAAYEADQLGALLIGKFLDSVLTEYQSSCLLFNTGTTAFKNQICSDLGKGNGCAAYPASCN